MSLSELVPYLSWNCPLTDSSQLAELGRIITEYVELVCHLQVSVTVDFSILSKRRVFSSKISASVDTKSQSFHLLLDSIATLTYASSKPSFDLRLATDLFSVPYSCLRNNDIFDPIVVSESLRFPHCSGIQNAVATIDESATALRLHAIGDDNKLRIYFPREWPERRHWVVDATKGLYLGAPAPVRDVWPSKCSQHTVFVLRVPNSKTKRTTYFCVLSKVSGGRLCFEEVQTMRFPFHNVKQHCSVHFETDNVLFFAANAVDDGKQLALYVCVPLSFFSMKKKKPKKTVPKTTSSESDAKSSDSSTPVTKPKKLRKKHDPISALTSKKKKGAALSGAKRKKRESRPPVAASKTAVCSRSPRRKVVRVLIPEPLQHVFREAKCHYAFWHQSSESIVLLIKKSNASMVGDPKMKSFVDALQQSYDSRGVHKSERVLGRLLLKLKLRLSKGSLPSLFSASIGSVRIEEAKTRIVAYDPRTAAVWFSTEKLRTEVVDDCTNLVNCQLRVARLNDLVYKWRHIF